MHPENHGMRPEAPGMTRTPFVALMSSQVAPFAYARGMKPSVIACLGAVIGAVFLTANTSSADDSLHLKLRSRAKTGPLSAIEKQADCNPRETALLICDMWHDHWCKSAA